MAPRRSVRWQRRECLDDFLVLRQPVRPRGFRCGLQCHLSWHGQMAATRRCRRSVLLHFRLSHSFLHTNLKVLVRSRTERHGGIEVCCGLHCLREHNPRFRSLHSGGASDATLAAGPVLRQSHGDGAEETRRVSRDGSGGRSSAAPTARTGAGMRGELFCCGARGRWWQCCGAGRRRAP